MNENNVWITKDIIENQLKELNQLVLEVTDSCNLKCKYCGYGEFYEDHDVRKNQLFNYEFAVILLKFLEPYWHSHLSVSYTKSIIDSGKLVLR